MLVGMALTAFDDDAPNRLTGKLQPARRYFGGQDAMAELLGHKPNDNGHRAARRAITELKSEGAIRSVQRGQTGSRAIYDLIGLNLMADDNHPVDN